MEHPKIITPLLNRIPFCFYDIYINGKGGRKQIYSVSWWIFVLNFPPYQAFVFDIFTLTQLIFWN